MKEKMKQYPYYLFFLFSGAVFLLIASRSSFLYPLNNWDDANSYFSMGKALFAGKTLYRDVFDQKGPYLYFLYGLAYLVSHTTFAGVYILETVLAFMDITGFYFILRLKLSDRTAAALAPLSYAVLCCSRSFWWGGAAEEICLPFIVWGLYLSLRYFEKEYPDGVMPLKTVFLGGLLAGFAANIKFTVLGFFFAWMMCVGFAYLSHKDLKGGIKACFVFLGGMLVPFLPWVIYFGLRHALYDWYWGYVYVNVFVYSEAEGLGAGLFEKLYSLAKLLYEIILENLPYFVLVIPGLFYLFFAPGRKLLTRLNAPLLFAFLFLGIFGGGRSLPYYSLPFSVFAVTGCLLIGVVLEKLWKKPAKWFYIAFPIVLTACALALIWFRSMNVPFMKEDREDFFLFRFRDEILSESENPTLLNVGCLDAGLYTLTDIVPTCRYFQTQTLHIEDRSKDPYAEQERYVEEGLTDYVIARNSYPVEIDEHYELIDSEVYGWSGIEFTYYLFRKVR